MSVLNRIAIRVPGSSFWIGLLMKCSGVNKLTPTPLLKREGQMVELSELILK
jgi:hypothetical protein